MNMDTSVADLGNQADLNAGDNSELALDIRAVDVLFGGKAAEQKTALALLDQGADREAILADTGVVLGVADANLGIPRGSLSVLMGLSGSGKSSLLRCINGLNSITRGELHINTREGSVDVAHCSRKQLRSLQRRHLAMVFQQFALLPWATVRENVGFGLSVRGESSADIKRQVDEQLELVHLEAWADKRIHELSGGMQQRVGLARAFATDADILLMDEPFSALDPLIREHLQDELLALQERLQKTIVFVSHDLDEALKLGNSISIMEGGRIVQTGSASDIVFRPATDYVKRFVANINPLSVLTAEAIMVGLEQYPALPRDAGATASIAGTVYDRQFLHPVDESSDRLAAQGGIVWQVPPATPIRRLLALAETSEQPLLVGEAHAAPLGVIGWREILRKLQGSNV